MMFVMAITIISFIIDIIINIVNNIIINFIINNTRPKPAYGRQGLDWSRRARIQFCGVLDQKNMETNKNHEKPWNYL